MEKQLTYLQAWADFWQWIREPEQRGRWQKIDRQGKQYLYKADIARRAETLGYERVKNILTTYAPERYDFREAVILKEDG